jgi:hypothetical protein
VVFLQSIPRDSGKKTRYSFGGRRRMPGVPAQCAVSLTFCAETATFCFLFTSRGEAMKRMDALRHAHTTLLCAASLLSVPARARAGTPGTHDEEIIIGVIIAADLLLIALFYFFRFLHRLWHPPAAAPDALLEHRSESSDIRSDADDDTLACLGTA